MNARHDYASLRASDLAHLWHPFTPIDAFERQDFPIIVRGEGVWLHDVQGRSLLDGISSWWCVNLGHSHPAVVRAIREQAACLQHSILGGMSHPNAILLAKRLGTCPPEGLERVYFCGDGASAVEASMRLAIEYWHHRGRPGKQGFITLADAYHGDTRGAVAAGYVEAFHAPLRPTLALARQAESPHCFVCPSRDACSLQCFDSMEWLVERYHNETAAVMIEPLCQGAAGMRIYPAEYLSRLRALCDAREVLLIADEIAVGFGRTGRLFACEKAGIVPDLMCLGKGLTAGTLAMSAVRCRQSLYDAFRDGPQGRARTFFHGHTFGGNPIAAAAALAALDIYLQDHFMEGVARNARVLRRGFERLAERPAVEQVKTLGMMSALRVKGGAEQARGIVLKALRNGLLIRPLGDILYLWPPLNATPQELETMLDRFESALGS